MTVDDLEKVTPLPCMREWHEREVLEPLRMARRRDYLCPECEGRREACHLCDGTRVVDLSALSRLVPVLADRIVTNALRGVPPHRWMDEEPLS